MVLRIASDGSDDAADLDELTVLLRREELVKTDAAGGRQRAAPVRLPSAPAPEVWASRPAAASS